MTSAKRALLYLLLRLGLRKVSTRIFNKQDSLFPSYRCLSQVFHGFRNIVATLRVLLLLAMPRGEGAGALPNSSADTSNVRGALFALPPPPPLDIHDSNAAEKWKEFEQAWKNYSIAMTLRQEPEAVQVATLLTVVAAEARKVFATFTDWASDTDQNKIQPVLQKFAAYCQPLKRESL